MNVLILCGVFAAENQQEVIDHARRSVEFSANLFQQKLIEGFRRSGCTLSVVSAPFIGSYPNASDIFYFRHFQESQTLCRYVSFCNLWGYRNISRAGALKHALADFIAADDTEKLLVVYSAHTPFLKAAAYAKKKDPRIRICFYVPDLPEYMNLSTDKSLLYVIAKKYDIMTMKRQMAYVDSFVLLTEQMKDMLPIGDKTYRVVEGIISELPQPIGAACVPHEKNIVYTGKLEQAFGIRDLIDSFALLQEPDYRLVLCGKGDSFEYARSVAARDPRIMVLGQVSPEEAARQQRDAAVLINPRANAGEYTKYSFPSKNIEYLLTGKPMVAYMLNGMPSCYRDFMYEIDPDQPAAEAISNAIRRAVEADAMEKHEKYRAFLQYAGERLVAENIANMIMDLSGSRKG